MHRCVPFTWTNIDITNILYISPKFWAIFDDFNQLNVWDSHCIQLDVISLYPWIFYTQELGNNQHAYVIWGEIIFELMQFGIIAYIFLRLRVWIATVHCTNEICTNASRNMNTYMYFQYFQISYLWPRIKWPGAYCF